MNLNKAFIIGRLTADPQLRTTPAGQSVATFSVATSRNWTDKAGARQEDVEYHNIVVWARQAEIASQFLTKGSLVMVEGRIQTRSWQDKQGQPRKTAEIICERMQLGPRPQGQGGGSSSFGGGNSNSNNSPSSFTPRSSTPAFASSSAPSAPLDMPPIEEIPIINLEDDDIKSEDLPF